MLQGVLQYMGQAQKWLSRRRWMETVLCTEEHKRGEVTHREVEYQSPGSRPTACLGTHNHALYCLPKSHTLCLLLTGKYY